MTGDGDADTTEIPATTTPTSECIDLNPKEKCEELKGDGRCEQWKPFMEKRCKETCGFCKILNMYFHIYPSFILFSNLSY